MSLSPKLIMRQSQSLVMTPQLMQAIKLLQLSSMDLATYVAQEIESNPLLERAEGEPGGDVDDGERHGDDGVASSEPREGDWMEARLPETRAEIEERFDSDLGNVFPDEAPANRSGGETYTASAWSGVGTGGGEDGDNGVEAYVSADATLIEHLENQLGLTLSDPRQRMIGRGIIDSVDETGYLSEPLDVIAARLGAPIDEVEVVLRIVQTFDPIGVAARSLEECLTIQLREKNRFDPAMAALMRNLELLARRDLPALRRICGVDGEDLAEMITELRALTPKPGLAFGGSPIQPVVPDVMVRSAPDGSWLIELNAETLPRLLVNQSYYATVSRTAKNQGEKQFLAECLQTGELAHPQSRTARPHHPQGLRRDRAPAGRLPHPRRSFPQADEPPRRRRRHRHA